jgi:hypothetical protein
MDRTSCEVAAEAAVGGLGRDGRAGPPAEPVTLSPVEKRERNRVPFKGWQWAEIGLLIVLLYGQIALIFTVLKDRPVLLLVIGLPPVALMVHMYTWLIPLWKARRG